jgi:hypothetical protein
MKKRGKELHLPKVELDWVITASRVKVSRTRHKKIVRKP